MIIKRIIDKKPRWVCKSPRGFYCKVTYNIFITLLLSALINKAYSTSELQKPFSEKFNKGTLNTNNWIKTFKGDIKEYSIAVRKLGDIDSNEFRLCLSMDTRKTSEKTVKFIGVRSLKQVCIITGTCITFDLDWNNQSNGCYLTTGIVLSPNRTSKNPLSCPNWLKVEYVGVPPGKNARMVIAISKDGKDRTLYKEGWPHKNKEGRKIGIQRIKIVFAEGAFRVWENNTMIYDSGEETLPFKASYLYFQMSSHSNYPLRKVYFNNIYVK